MRTTVRSLLAAASFLALTGVASAADLPVAQRFPVAPFSWTGIYAGANLGYAWANATNLDADGVIGGGQIGANWQTGNIVFGVEADLQASDVSSTQTATSGALTIRETVSADYFGTLRGRIGYASDRWMIYGTGGLAYTTLDHNGVGVTGVAGSYTASNSLTGWTAGGGVEWAFWDRWSVKAEYLFMSFGSHSNTYATTVPAIIVNYGEFEENVVRAGLNYRF